MRLLIVALLSLSIQALPLGNYELEKIQCRNQDGSEGKTLKLGGKFMQYKVLLNVTDAELRMVVNAKSAKWAPFKLRCEQINEGKYSLVGDTQYEGFLSMTKAKCNAKMWEKILLKHGFGIEEQGVFTYSASANKLQVYNKETITKYSCEDTNAYPVYYYIKK